MCISSLESIILFELWGRFFFLYHYIMDEAVLRVSFSSKGDSNKNVVNQNICQ